MNKAVRNAWLSLLGIPVVQLLFFVAGSLLFGLVGGSEGQPLPLWAAPILLLVLLGLYAALALFARHLALPAVRTGNKAALIPMWIVLGFGVLTTGLAVVSYVGLLAG